MDDERLAAIRFLVETAPSTRGLETEDAIFAEKARAALVALLAENAKLRDGIQYQDNFLVRALPGGEYAFVARMVRRLIGESDDDLVAQQEAEPVVTDHTHQWHAIEARWETTPDGGGDKRYRVQCTLCRLIWEHS